MKPMPVFCTVFDKNYLYQGLATYLSLEKTVPNFSLYCLAMDDIAATTLEKLNLKFMKVVRLGNLKQDELNEIRPLTTYGQFCWCMQPLICRYALDQGEASVTYIEADALFFSNPQILIDEIGERSISLAPHWYSPGYGHLGNESGIYCTHFNYFKNNETGRACIEYWKNQCFLYRAEKPYYLPGQYCLNDWEAKFKDVAVLKNRGAGVAPWNVQQYQLASADGIPSVNGQKAVFYHYHQVGRYADGRYELGDYPLSQDAIHLFYAPYIQAIQESEARVAKVDSTFNYFKRTTPPPNFLKALASGKLSDIKKSLRPIKRRLNHTYNIFDAKALIGLRSKA